MVFRLLEDSKKSVTVTEPTPNDTIDLRVGLMAIREEFLNLSELKHCLSVREKILKRGERVDDFGDILVRERYLTPENLEYLHMIAGAQGGGAPVTIGDIEAEFQGYIAEIKKGAEFGSFKIVDELGRGGMGVVLRAIDSGSGDEIALKILIGRDNATVRDIERFKKEATVMMPLIHPGIVKIMDVGRVRGLDYIAMEYVRGRSLKELVEDTPNIDPISALQIIRSAGEAVAFIHGEGIIHRDIKPENIMVRDEDGSAVLMDFGLAGWDKIEVMAGRGSIGTPMYQPPEQAEVGGPFGKISPASDVYGLGATLYYLLTGRHPFSGRSVKEVREKIKRIPPATPTSHRPNLPKAVEALVLRCMKKRQSERFSTPREFVDHIDKVLKLLGGSRRKQPSSKLSLKAGRAVSKAARPTGKRTRRKVGVASSTKKPSPGRRTKGLRRPTEAARRTSGASDTGAMRFHAPTPQWYENPVVIVMAVIALLLVLLLVGIRLTS
jgi:serine/threonine protein kinase